MKFWQSFSYSAPEECLALAQAAEAAGYDGVSIAEHIFFPKHLQSKYPYTDDDSPTFEADAEWTDVWTTIAAMAAVTERLNFSTSISILPLYNPFQCAKTLATLARISGNRVCVGAGAGWMKEEFAALGVDFKSRGKRYTESIELMRKLWTGDYISYSGEHFQCDEVVMLPKPERPIPIWIAGKSKVALKRAATLGDGWLATGEPVEETIQLMEQLTELRKQAGRDHLPFDMVTIQPFAALNDNDIERLQRAGATGIKNWTFCFVMGDENASLQQKQDYLVSQQAFIQRYC